MKTTPTLLFVLFLTLGLDAADPDKPIFKAGAAVGTVTPPLGSSINGGFQDGKAAYIHDDPFVRCLALDDGKTRIVLIVVDSCVIGRGIFDEAKGQIHEATGIPVEHLLMSSASRRNSRPTARSNLSPATSRRRSREFTRASPGTIMCRSRWRSAS